MGGRVALCGDLAARFEAERLLAEAHPELHVESVATPQELVQAASSGPLDLALLLKTPIAQHQDRVQAVAALRREGFRGPILFAGAFLSEREDATAAGADLVFDPDARRLEETVASALERPRLAADHPYLRHLFVGERLELLAYGPALPEHVDVLLAATSCHDDPAFWRQLAGHARAHPDLRCVLVEDGGSEDVRVEAISTGLQPHVVLAEEGLLPLHGLCRGFLREAWLRRLRG